MKNKMIAFGICALMLLVVFSSGCVEEEKGVGEKTTDLKQRLSVLESNYTNLEQEITNLQNNYTSLQNKYEELQKECEYEKPVARASLYPNVSVYEGEEAGEYEAHLMGTSVLEWVFVNETVFLIGIGFAPDGQIVKFEWDFDGDGVYDWDSTINDTSNTTYVYDMYGNCAWMVIPHVYDVCGNYTAVFRVTDNNGSTDMDICLIGVSEPVGVEEAPPVMALSILSKTSDNVNNTMIVGCSRSADYWNVSWYLLDNDGISQASGTFAAPMTSAPTAGASTTPDVDWVDNDGDNRLSTGDVIFINENSWNKNIVPGWTFKLVYIPSGETMAIVTYP